MQARILIQECPRQMYWGEFFTRARLHPLFAFGEFMRDPEGIVASLTDPDAPPPASMPRLRERIAALLVLDPPRLAA